MAVSCRSTKDTHKNIETVDITKVRDLIDSFELYKSEYLKLSAEIRELQYSGVVFDSSRCPPPVINVPKDCNVDSILQLLSMLRDKVKIFSDGTIEAEGKLKSAYYSKDKLNRVITELQRINDSLRVVKQKENIKYVEKIVEVDKKKKSTFLNQWWLFPAGFITCLFVVYRKKIFQL